MPGLTIYKASAGSGKTFAITREYIRLLFRDPDNYRRILGVTFTNKATAEMKSRIVAELNRLATGQKSGYEADLLKTFNVDPKVLQQRASLILSKILHDYSHFTILTIDSFFQRVIRSFAREIGFYQGFDVELDQNKILTAAVDQMIFELDKNPVLKDWLVRFAEDKIVEGQSWDINRDIQSLGSEVFKENFKEFGDTLIAKITDKQFLDTFYARLDVIKSGFESNFKQKGSEALDIMQKYGLAKDDFKGKSRSIGNFFEKLSQTDRFSKWELKDTTRNHFNDVDQWIGKASPKEAEIRTAFDTGLNRLLGEIIAMTDDELPRYLSAVEVQKHLYVLGVVADLLVHIREYTSGRNLFMISDTAQFLRKLITGSDAPFVYERTGTFIKHFMIDEFQDTSALQWANFKPLIINSLSENNENWVVGDVKQSIYRWRNSDWTILSEKIFDDIHPHPVNVETLQYNWRSSRNIIRFNNSFFRNAIEILMNSVMASHEGVNADGIANFEHLLTNAYSDFAQLVPDNKNTDRGYVNIEIVPASDDKDISFDDMALERLPKIIENAQDRGFSLSDMAILIRTRAEGDTVSEYLLKYQKQQSGSKYRYDILSNDSLLLKNSEAVKWLVAAFKYVTSPDDLLNKAFLAYEYQAYLFEEERDIQHATFDFSTSENLPGELGEFFNQPGLKQFPVYELCDSLIATFGLTRLKGELPFVQAFQDMLQEYSRKEPVDLNSFLNWWDENMDKRVISMPEGQDAIRLMTFHSAKGLEFKCVIMPFADWNFIKTGWNSNILWCNTTAEPFNSLDLLPVSLSKGLQNTIFSGDYYREKAMSYVDNLNLLYVAFTRAVDALYVIVPEQTKDSVENMAALITQSVQNQTFAPENVDYPAIKLTDYWKTDENRFEYGELPLLEEKKAPEENITLDDTGYTVRMVSDVVKQVIPAGDYFGNEGKILASRINTGKIMHEVFQRIKTPEDVDNALLALHLEGKISEQDSKSLNTDIKKLLNNKQVLTWFSSDWKVRTEAGILLKDGTIPRPDRVLTKETKAIVVDYKFGETESPSYQWQVRNYMRYLSQMGYKDVTGYLWYVALNKIETVSTAPEQGRLF
ncbi:MAG: UvrD-helicase domain-containing protein [Bacteroidota bacterium]|nr:UvrD-helicase domain-containing protein [Bacteroidota bacterium]